MHVRINVDFVRDGAQSRIRSSRALAEIVDADVMGTAPGAGVRVFRGQLYVLSAIVDSGRLLSPALQLVYHLEDRFQKANAMSFLERSRRVFESLAGSPARLPSRLEIPLSRVDNPAKLGERLVPGKRYFQVRVNEMFLAEERDWFKTYYPMVYVGSEFLYDRAEVSIPFVIGPTALGPSVDMATHDMVFRNTRVAGVSPYRGGRLTITLVLYRVTKEHYARNFLSMVENLAGALDFASALSAYMRISGALLDGVETLTGTKDTAPVIGHRIEIDPDAGDAIDPGYFALIDMPDDQLKSYEFWVRDDALVYGASLDAAKPFRDADYVLYSLASTDQRSDIEKLPFFEIWQRVLRDAAVPKDESYDSAKSNMLSLYQTMLLSPDLVRDHARALASAYSKEMRQTFDDAVDMATLSDAPGDTDDQSEVRNESLKILEM